MLLMVPGRAVNTTTRSARAIASSIWWVTNSTRGAAVAPDLDQEILELRAGLHVEGPRRARPSAARSASWPVHGPPRRAGACPPTAPPGACPRSRRGRLRSATPWRSGARLRLRHASQLEPEGHIFDHREPWVEGRFLKDQAAVAVGFRNRYGPWPSMIPSVRSSRPAIQIQKGGLAAAARPSSTMNSLRPTSRLKSLSASTARSVPRAPDLGDVRATDRPAAHWPKASDSLLLSSVSPLAPYGCQYSARRWISRKATSSRKPTTPMMSIVKNANWASNVFREMMITRPRPAADSHGLGDQHDHPGGDNRLSRRTTNSPGRNRRQDDLDEYLKARRSHDPRDLDIGRRQGVDEAQGRQRHYEEQCDVDQKDRRCIAQAEDQHGDGQPGDRRDRRQQVDHGQDELAEQRREPDRHADREADEQRDHEAADHAHRRGADRLGDGLCDSRPADGFPNRSTCRTACRPEGYPAGRCAAAASASGSPNPCTSRTPRCRRTARPNPIPPSDHGRRLDSRLGSTLLAVMLIFAVTPELRAPNRACGPGCIAR